MGERRWGKRVLRPRTGAADRIESNEDPAATRTRGLKLALLTYLGGKGVSTLVQLAALPLAISALGQARFGAYAMLAALLNWISIASVTITPGLTVQIVATHARREQHEEGGAVGSALVFSCLLALLLASAVQLVFHIVGLKGMFGASYGTFGADLWRSIDLLTAFIAMNVVFSVADGAQAGYQKQYIHNVFLAFGNLFTIVAILTLVRRAPSISNMIVAVYCGPLIGRALSLAQVISSRPYLIGGMLRVDLRAVASMVRTGSAFFLTSVSSFCYQSLTVYMVGRQRGPVLATEMSVFITILNALGSTLMMFTQSLWPAVRHATVRGDIGWVNRTYVNTVKYLMIYILGAAAAIAVAGDKIIDLWVRPHVQTESAARVVLGVYFLLVAWEQVNYSFLIGLGSFWFASICYFLGAVTMLLNSTWLVGQFGVSGVLIAMCLGPLLFTAWPYPLKLKQALHSRRRAAARMAGT